MLKHRLITGSLLVLFLIILATIDQSATGGDSFLARGVLLMIVCCLVAVPLLALELATILRRLDSRASGWVSAVGAGLLCFTMWLAAAPGFETSRVIGQLPGLVLAGVFAVAFIDACAGRRTQGVVTEVAGTLFAVLYGGGLMGFWLMLRQDASAWVIMGAILTVKMSDIGAYTVGCSIGRTRLIPWLSPKKTWEGLVGGIVFSMVSGGLLAWMGQELQGVDASVSIGMGVVFGFLAAWVGLLGDLIASAIKRDAAIKDSSRILPGLGGLVDALDSLLLTAPLAWLLLG